jgi:type 2 lantibiotic biosynthesis protein LanM
MSRSGVLTDDAGAGAWTVAAGAPRANTAASAPRALLDRWRGAPLKDRAAFDAYLAQLGLSPSGLAQVLSGSSWTHRAGADPWWSTAGRELWQPRDGAGSRAPATGPRPVVIENTLFDRLPFAGLLLDPLRRHDQRLRERLRDLERTGQALVPVPDAVHADLRAALAGRLGQAAVRCLLAELHRRRKSGDLDGASSTEQYEDFDRSLRSLAVRGDLFARYPCLARDLTTIGRQWEVSSTDLLRRLADDRDALIESGLLAGTASVPTGVESTAGDPHEGGESVSVLTFADGRRLVYKPRDTRIYDLYRRVAEALRPELPPEVTLRAPRVLARARYGWVEYIDAGTEPLSAPRLTRYLRNFGAAAGLAHVLGGCDLHLENVIATDLCPVPVDLETIVQNRGDAHHALATERAIELLNSSVLGSGYLPVSIGDRDQGTIDVSVLTGGLGAPPSGEALRVIDAFTSQMRIEYRPQTVGRSRNQPPGMTLNAVRDNAEALATGFTDLCHAAIRRGETILRLIAEADNITFRHLVRPTRSYSLLLQEATQPYCSGSGLARDNLFNRLWHRLREHPDEAPVVMAELAALHRRDVPLFYGDLDGHRLRADGRPVHEAFARTGREELARRITNLTPDGVREQRDLLLEAIAAATAGPDQDSEASCGRRGAPARAVGQPVVITRSVTRQTRDLARAAAEAVAARLEDAAIAGENDVTWVGVSSGAGNEGLEYRPLGTTLYDGLAGVGVALCHAGRVLDDERLIDLAGRALEPVRGHLADWLTGTTSLPVGGFSGVGGALLALGHHAHVGGDPMSRSTYHDILRRLASGVAEDTYLDVTTGAAGLCAVLAADPGGRSDPDVRACVKAAVDRLTETSDRFPDGSRGWAVGDERVYLGGFSHGSTGIGWALARAGSLLDDPLVIETARQALAFDDRLFDPAARRWADARPETRSRPGGHHPVHWCHGAAGIALGRIDAARMLKDEALLRQGLEAAAIVEEAGLPPNDSLCHGSLGNWETLHLASSVEEGSGGFRTVERRWRRAILDRVLGRGFFPGLPDGVRTVPGLLLGTSGALMTFCRFVEPDAVPPVLLLAPPA